MKYILATLILFLIPEPVSAGFVAGFVKALTWKKVLGYVVVAAISSRILKKKRKRQNFDIAEGLNNVTVTTRGNQSNRPIPVCYGQSWTKGLENPLKTNKAFSKDKTFPGFGRVRITDADSNIGTSVLPAGSHTEQRYAVSEYTISVGENDRMVDCFIDGVPITTEKYKNTYFLTWANYTNINSLRNLIRLGRNNERGDNLRATGLCVAAGIFYLDITLGTTEETKDQRPPYQNQPDLDFFLLGRKIRTLDTQLNARSNARVYSNQSVDVLYDYLTDKDFGPGLVVDEDIDLASFVSARDPRLISELGDYPSELNTIQGTRFSTWAEYWNTVTTPLAIQRLQYGDVYSTLTRHQFNGNPTTQRKWMDTVDIFTETIPGSFPFRDNKSQYRLSVVDFQTPAELQSVMTIDESLLVKPAVESALDADQRVNRFTCKYADIELDLAGNTLEFPRPGSLLDLQLQAADGNRVFRRQEQLEGINNIYQARSFAATEILISRRRTYSWQMNIVGMWLEPGDIIRLIDPLQNIDSYVRIEEKNPPEDDLTFKFSGVEFYHLDYAPVCTDNLQLVIDIPQTQDVEIPLMTQSDLEAVSTAEYAPNTPGAYESVRRGATDSDSGPGSNTKDGYLSTDTD